MIAWLSIFPIVGVPETEDVVSAAFTSGSQRSNSSGWEHTPLTPTTAWSLVSQYFLPVVTILAVVLTQAWIAWNKWDGHHPWVTRLMWPHLECQISFARDLFQLANNDNTWRRGNVRLVSVEGFMAIVAVIVALVSLHWRWFTASACAVAVLICAVYNLRADYTISGNETSVLETTLERMTHLTLTATEADGRWSHEHIGLMKHILSEVKRATDPNGAGGVAITPKELSDSIILAVDKYQKRALDDIQREIRRSYAKRAAH